MITHRFIIPNIGIKANRLSFVLTAYLEVLDVYRCSYHFANLEPETLYQLREKGELQYKSFSLSDKACLTLSKLHTEHQDSTLQSLIIDILNMINLDVEFKWNYRHHFI